MKKLIAVLLIFAISLPCYAVPSDKMTEYLQRAKTEGVIFGNEKGDLESDKVAVRAEFLAILVRFLGLSGGENTFSDVKDSDWFAESIAAANISGIFAGYEDGTARPYEPIKTEDAIAILGRYYNVSAHRGSYKGVSSYAEDYFGYAFENGIFSAWQHLPAPKQGITKGEIVSILYRYREENAENLCFCENYPKLSEVQSFNSLSVDLKFDEDCAAYYNLCEKGSQVHKWVKISENIQKGTVKTINLTADMNKLYDLYIRAVSTESGRSRIKELKSVSPLAFIKGEGTEESPYVIYTELQLAGIASFPDKVYALGGDIKLSKKWEPIESFSGSLSGEGYRITGLSISGIDKNAGLFAEIKGGTVKNLTVDAQVNAKSTAGIIAGQNFGTIESCCVTGTVEVMNNNGGGLCGINGGEIRDCLTCAYSVKAGSFAGGISGQNTGRILNSLSAVETVTSEMYAGGISGQNKGGSIENCVAANIAVYNTMTYNGGKISANKQEGKTKNNFSLSGMISNSTLTEESADSRNGLEVSWDELKNLEFYLGIGWNSKNWETAKSGFRLVCPKVAAEPILKSGLTQYCPQKIYTADNLIAIKKNCKGHYILANDITLQIPWKTIDEKDGFSGTLDGDGHIIHGLSLKGGSGIFSNITGGTVKNLELAGVTAYQGFEGGIIAACNYGYIENCTVSGTISTQKARIIGGIAGENNGRIAECTANLEITGDGAEVGGICALNNAVIEKCAFSGKIQITGDGAEVGGICASDTEGYISESAENAEISAKGDELYLGGICARSQDTQVYKCACLGRLKHTGGSACIGGICALADGSTVYNCLSAKNISSDAKNTVSGGICGEVCAVNIQNTYSSGSITLSAENTVSGGICAIAEGSYIMQNAALNPTVSAKGTANAVVAEADGCDISDNYICVSMIVNLGPVGYEESKGTAKPVGELLNADFYLTHISQGGLLGWDDTAWEKSETGYLLPVLTDTPLMAGLENPKYR